MCLIIFSPNVNRSRIRKSVMERAFFRNDDGAGLAYIENDEVKVSKAYYAFEDFFLAYQQIRSKITKGPLLIHFRRATCGSNTRTNTQPLVIYRNRLVMAHNGVISSMSDDKGDISDSVVLTRTIREMGWNYPFIKIQNELLGRLCGNYSKLVFLNNKGRYTIINEDLGKWWHGCWYSNEHSLPTIPAKKAKYACSEYKASESQINSYFKKRENIIKKPHVPLTREQIDAMNDWQKRLNEEERRERERDLERQSIEEGGKYAMDTDKENQFRRHSVVDKTDIVTDYDQMTEEEWQTIQIYKASKIVT